MRTHSTASKVYLASTALAALGLTGIAQAQEVGRVLSTTPVIQQVAVPRQTCTTEQVSVEQPKSGAGALMGAIAGGAIGNNVGGGNGRALATMIGLVGGAVAGNNIEGPAGVQMQNVQRCSTQTFYENRTVAYNVVYEYAGKQYQVQMQNDPGSVVQLQVTPVGTLQGGQPQAGSVPGIPAPVIQPISVAQPVYQAAPVAVASPQVIYAQPQVVYTQPQVVYTRPYYPAPYPVVGIGYGWRGGYGYRRWH